MTTFQHVRCRIRWYLACAEVGSVVAVLKPLD
jgi:hypothetical protein